MALGEMLQGRMPDSTRHSVSVMTLDTAATEAQRLEVVELAPLAVLQLPLTKGEGSQTKCRTSSA